MVVTIIFSLIGSNITIMAGIFMLMFTVKTSLNESQKEQKEFRIQMMNLIRSLETFTKENISAIREEMKDFHGRLCSIEERRK